MKKAAEDREVETSCAETEPAELPVEASYAVHTGQSAVALYPQSQYGGYQSSHFINAPASSYSPQYLVQSQPVEDDENTVWSKVVAMQLRKMHPYEAAKLRLQIDSVIVKAMKPSCEK